MYIKAKNLLDVHNYFCKFFIQMCTKRLKLCVQELEIRHVNRPNQATQDMLQPYDRKTPYNLMTDFGAEVVGCV